MSAITAAALLGRRRRFVAQGVSARIDRVEVQGCAFAVKRFEARTRPAWSREVASHLCCAQPEVIGIIAYGLDDRGRSWLATSWREARQARYWIKNGHPELQATAEAWLDLFQTRLSLFGYRWYDATTRNLLLSAEQLTRPRPAFQVVDYTLVPFRNQLAFAECLVELEKMQPAEWRQSSAGCLQ